MVVNISFFSSEKIRNNVVKKKDFIFVLECKFMCVKKNFMLLMETPKLSTKIQGKISLHL